MPTETETGTVVNSPLPEIDNEVCTIQANRYGRQELKVATVNSYHAKEEMKRNYIRVGGGAKLFTGSEDR